MSEQNPSSPVNPGDSTTPHAREDAPSVSIVGALGSGKSGSVATGRVLINRAAHHRQKGSAGFRANLDYRVMLGRTTPQA